ncbi:MAG: peptidylprolyl isomerase [Paludibacteraceae bacterium]|nr:peptidylprolyl isomerase [Paludibacteraceae bacterium]
MKKVLFAFLALASALTATAQEDPVVMTINGKEIQSSEFLYLYQKNNQETTGTQKSMDEYLDLFINFKLKVAEAEAQHLDTSASFIKELAGYRAQATPKYMKDPLAFDSLVALSYDRMTRDRRAAHIVLRCDANANAETVEAVTAKMTAIRNRVSTANFKTVAKEVSEDQGVQENEGELGWITPFRYVYSLENAVYTTPVGEISEIFRTPFGMHIVWVEEERPHEEIHAAHIMKMVPKGNDSIEVIAKHQIDSIYKVLQNGGDFAELATQYSDDKGSAKRGGDLNWFGKGLMVKPFEDAVFALNPGEMTAPFKSKFGWHIARVIDRRDILPLDSLRPQLQKNVQRDERMKEADKAFIRKVRAEYNLEESMSDADVRAYADAHLEEKYPELRNLVREYHDGILLFDISMQNVWDKASKDQEGLTKFFKAHKKEYKWDAPRWKGFVIHATDMATAIQVRSIIKSSEADSVSKLIAEYINTDSVKVVRLEHGLWTKGQNAAVDKYGFKQKTAEYAGDDQLPVTILVGKLLKAPESYTDERGKVTNAYQDELEKVWISELRKKYEVVVNREVFENLKKNN